MPRTPFQTIYDQKGLEKHFGIVQSYLSFKGLSIDTIALQFDSAELLAYNARTSELKITNNVEFHHDVVDAIDMAGIYPLTVEVSLSSRKGTDFEVVDNHIVKNGSTESIPLLMTSGTKYFPSWLPSISRLIGNDVYFVPDTNIIRSHYYSHQFRSYSKQGDIKYKLSRITLLEIENKFNKGSSELGKSIKEISNREKQLEELKQNGKEIEQQLEKLHKNRTKAEREINVGFHAMKEIWQMREDGVEDLPESDPDLVKSFPSVSGKGAADALIRREIQGAASIQKGTYFFLTGDKRNAAAATAQGINTIVVSRGGTDWETLRIDVSQLCEIVISCALNFGKCKVAISYDDGKDEYIVHGNWAGKTRDAWQGERIKLTSADHLA